MAKAGDLIGRSGAGGLGPIPRPASSAFTAPPAEGEKEAPKGTRTAKKGAKPAKGPAKGKGEGGGPTRTPSVRPKV